MDTQKLLNVPLYLGRRVQGLQRLVCVGPGADFCGISGRLFGLILPQLASEAHRAIFLIAATGCFQMEVK